MPEPAEQLRAAAQRLRELAEAATPGPWHAVASVPSHSVRSPGGWEIASSAYADRRADMDFIAAMHPGVALALATLLESHSADWDQLTEHNAHTTDGQDHPEAPDEAMEEALALARLVLEAK
jgi:hypothetical protein